MPPLLSIFIYIFVGSIIANVLRMLGYVDKIAQGDEIVEWGIFAIICITWLPLMVILIPTILIEFVKKVSKK